MIENINPITVSAVVLGVSILLRLAKSFNEIQLVIKKDKETSLILRKGESKSTPSHTEDSSLTAVLREQELHPTLNQKETRVSIPQPKAPRINRRAKKASKKMLIGKNLQKL